MEDKKETKPRVKICIIGHVGYGRAKLIEEIEKILKEKNNEKSKKEKLKEKVKSTSEHEIFVDDNMKS